MSNQHKYICDGSTACQPIEVKLTRGKFLIECYGAQGGPAHSNSGVNQGGKGAYASGILNLKKTTTFFLYIGGQGQDGTGQQWTYAKGGWNGGGNSGTYSSTVAATSASGGGCTDIRMIKAVENAESTDQTSLNSRIIVAAGGSGATYNLNGAPGGDLNAYRVTSSIVTGQLSSLLGRGENGKQGNPMPSSGAGSGYHGGTSVDGWVNVFDTNSLVSSSGSSYVAGYPGCDSLPTNDARYSVFGSKLIDPQIFNGFSPFPSFDKEGTETGHSGNGAVKITLLEAYTVLTKKINNIVLFHFVIVFINNQNSKIIS